MIWWILLCACPVSLKLNNLRDIIDINENEPFNKKEEYFKKTNDGKKILRDVMRNFIPEEIANAQKKGFHHQIQAGLNQKV